MVHPISGPFIRTSSPPWFWEYRLAMKQKPPFNLALPYTLQQGTCLTVSESTRTDASRFKTWAYNENVRFRDRMYAKAYERFVDKLGESASLGLNLAQWRQADDMIRKRGSQLTGFATSLFRRSPVGVAASLGISVKRARAVMEDRHGSKRSLADLWLEFWFGWKPLVGDIYSACQVFDNELSLERVKGRSGKMKIQMATYQSPVNFYGEGIKWESEHSCTLGADVSVVNPNLRLMESFGLLNLASIGVDAVPWSFVVGWFGNLNSYLSSLTELAGLRFDNAYVTHTTKLWGETWWPYDPSRGGKGHGVFVVRQLISQPPRPKLLFDWKRWQPTRGATAISLLVQKLPRS